MTNNPSTKKVILVSIYIFLLYSIASSAFSQSLGENDKLTINLDNKFIESKKYSANANNFLGLNNLYWIDDNPSWKKFNLEKKIEDLNVKTLRFPGGEVADNYDWETNSLERPNAFPYEAETPRLKRDRLDYLEFLKNARNSHVDNIFFVVNLEGAFLSPGDKNANVLRYAIKAAKWVQEVKRNGYYVKYWEIGNESYLNQTAYLLTAEEYANALNIFATEMRKADPTILIGAVGPRDPNSGGIINALTQEQLSFYRNSNADTGKKFCKNNNKKGKDCINLIKKLVPGKSEQKFWWDTIATQAKNSFDFAVIHDYSMDDNLLTPSEVTEKLISYLQNKTGRPIQLALTEWNAPAPGKKFTPEDFLLNIAIKSGNYLAGGVSQAIFWPLRYKNNNQALLTYEEAKPTNVYQVLKIISPVLNGKVVNQDLIADNVYFLETVSNNNEFAMIVNRSQHEKLIESKPLDSTKITVEIKQFNAKNATESVTQKDAKMSAKSIEFISPPKSISIIKITKH